MLQQTYLAYHYNEETDNSLQKNSYRGNLAQVRNHIDDGINVYSRTPELHETPLHLAMVGDHCDIVNLILNVYEQDLKFIEQTIGFRPKTPILIGFGEDDVQIAQNLFNEYEQSEISSNNNTVDSSKCVVILLKRDNFRVEQVLCLSPQSENGKQLTVHMIRRLIKNGVLDMNGSTRIGDSLIKVAAAGGSSDLFYKLIDLGAEVNCIEEIALFAIKFGQTKFLDDFKQKYAFEMADIFKSDNFKSVIFRSCKWAIVEYVGDKLVAEQKFTWSEIVNSLFHQAVLYNHFEIFQNFLRYNPQLIIKNLRGNIPLHNLYLCRKSANLVMEMIGIDPTQLWIRDNIGYSIIHKLALANRTSEITAIFEKYPGTKRIFFEEKDFGLMVVEFLISRKYYEITRIVIENSEVDTKLLYHILNKTATGDNFELFNYVLSLETYDFTLPPQEGEHHVLMTALQYQNLAMFKAIRSKISFNLNEITTEGGLNLLHFAIWKKRPVFEKVISCCKQSSDSEDEDKKSRLKIISPFSTQDLYKITEQDLILCDEFNELFDQLVENEVDCRKMCALGKNLVHHSVDANNVYTTKKLLDLGVQLNVYDYTGNLPMHYMRKVEMLQIFSSTSLSYVLNERNMINGKSLLHYLSEQPGEQEIINLIRQILNHGADINAIDNLNRSPIYYAIDLEIVKILLEHRINLNMQDLNGDTPIHSAFARSCYDIANLLLEQNTTDYTILNNDGISYLACLTNGRIIGPDVVTQFPSVVTLENEKFRILLKTHCNDCNEFGTPIFIESIGTSDLLCNMLLEVATDLDIFVLDPKTRDTALHVAARFSKCDLVDKLIARGLSIEQRNSNGDTCLLVYCERSFDKLERFLKYRPKVNVKNECGMSPILYVSSVDITGEAICDLLINGGDIMDCDSHGQTAFGNLSKEFKQIFKFLIN